MSHKQLNRIFALAVLFVGLIVYGKTVAPTTSYWDCGEFITCSYILGVPHPPGAPLFILLGRIFTMLPLFTDIGLRVNIISVITSALTVMFAYLIIVRLLREWRDLPQTIEDKLIMYTSGVIGALGFAFTDSFWFNAVEAEVYSISMFFTAIVVWLIMVWSEKSDNQMASDRILLLIAYLIGLAVGLHLLNILAIPTLFLIVFFKKGEQNLKTFTLWAAVAGASFAAIYPGIVKGVPWMLHTAGFVFLGAAFLALVFGAYYTLKNHQRIASLVLMSTLLITIGYSTYSLIYIRSGLNPVINENAPNTPEAFVSYLNREQYGDIPLTERRAPWEYQLKKMYVRYFGWQFIGQGSTLGSDGYIVEILSTKGLMGLPFIIGLVGMFYHFTHDRKRAFSILTLFIMTGIAIAIYLNQEDPQPRERDYAYVGSFFAFSIWVGIGAGAILELVLDYINRSLLLRRIGVAATILLLVVAVPVNLFSHNYKTHDRTGNYVAYDYSYNILQSCAKDAILFTNGDNDTFPLWFLQYVYGIRKDVRVVNLSLLNTPWYIKQLRDDEPKVPINLTDAQIDKISATLWEEPKMYKIKVPRDKVLEYLENENDSATLSPADVPEQPEIRFELSATRNIGSYPVLLVQDLMVVHIIGANAFKKPVYFAVTVSPTNTLGLDNRNNKPGLQNYLRMDGLAFRVMPYGGDRQFLAPDLLYENLFEKFQYRNLNNPEVYYSHNIVGLLGNYRSAYYRLATYYQSQKELEKMVTVLDKMEESIPEDVIPQRIYQLSVNLGMMYAQAGRVDELERRVDRVLTTTALQPMDKLSLATLYTQELKNDTKAESLAMVVMDENPMRPEPYSWLASFYAGSKQYDRGIEMLEKMQLQFPNNNMARQQIEMLRGMAKMDSTKADTTGR